MKLAPKPQTPTGTQAARAASNPAEKAQGAALLLRVGVGPRLEGGVGARGKPTVLGERSMELEGFCLLWLW